MQATIKAHVSSILLAETNPGQHDTKLKEHEKKLFAIRNVYSDATFRVIGLEKKVDSLEGKIKEAAEEVGTIKREAASSFNLGGEAVMEGTRRAWDQEIEGVGF